MNQPYPHYRHSGVTWLGQMPEHWQIRAFWLLLDEPLKYGANEAARLSDPELPRFVRISDIDDKGRLRSNTFRSLPFEIAKPYLLEPGDLLFARSGSVGRTFLYDESWGPCAYAGYLIRARVDHSQVLPEFISFFSAQWQYRQRSRMSAQKNTPACLFHYRPLRSNMPSPHSWIGRRGRLMRC